MKILRIIARLNVGGPARHVIWLTRAFDEGDHTTTLVAGTVPKGEEDMGYLAAEAGIEPFYIREMSRELSPKDVISLFKLYRVLLRTRPDVVHTHTAKAGTIGRVAAFAYKFLTPGILLGRPRQVRVVHTFHGHVFHSYYGNAKTKLFITIERALARFATDRIIVITRQQREEIHNTFNVGREEQFVTIPLGIDLGPFSENAGKRSAIRAELRASDADVLVGFIGRLTEIKNLSMFLRVAKKVNDSREDVGGKIRFAIIGDGHLRPALEREAEQLGLGEVVTFLGNRTDVAAVYSGLDIVALTSFNEGTPLSLIEAMAAGIPVISTKVGGVTDLLGETIERAEGFEVCERGIAAPSDDHEAFAKGLIYLAKDEKLRERLGESGRSFVHAHYSKERLIADIEALYRDLTAGSLK